MHIHKFILYPLFLIFCLIYFGILRSSFDKFEKLQYNLGILSEL